jgi:hypothetical protein
MYLYSENITPALYIHINIFKIIYNTLLAIIVYEIHLT